MRGSTRARHLVGLVTAAAIVLAIAGCSGDNSATDADSVAPPTDTAASASSTTSTTTAASTTTLAPATTTTAPPAGSDTSPPALRDIADATVEGPVSGGNGVILGAVNYDPAPFSYVEEEFFIAGTASSFESAETLSENGEWTVTPGDSADYRTRIVVRRPADIADASGTVMVEWLNVTAGFDTGPTWSFGAPHIQRSGAIWVGVSAQRVGVEGGGNELGAVRVLKTADPERYGSLSHPGDDYSYDMFSQVGKVIWTQADTVLGGVQPARVIALGESQSAFRMTTYINAVAPLHDAYSGYFVHSRGARAAALATPEPGADVPGPEIARIRTDLTRPVLTLSAETDVIGERLGYRRAAQPDTAVFRSWEVAGTAHGDAYSLGIGDADDGSGAADRALFEAMLNPPSSIYFGIVSCDAPINTGPFTYVTRAALAALEQWVTTGEAPPEQPLLQIDDTGDAFAVDELGNALGGIRSPQMDVPVAVLSGFGQSGESFCGLFGTTRTLTADELAAAYGDKATFLARWNEAVDAAVEAGVMLAADADHVKAAAEAVPLP